VAVQSAIQKAMQGLLKCYPLVPGLFLKQALANERVDFGFA
jgi:hypothetical protein